MVEISIEYYYQRGEKSSDNLSNLISRHHVISYPKMYYLGILALCYLKKRQEENKSIVYQENLLKGICRNTNININNALKYIISYEEGKFSIPRENAIIQNVINELAWLPINLFTGPSAKIRIDDPSQNNETFPQKMPKKQKTALQNIIDALKNYSHSYIPNSSGDGGSTKCVHFDKDSEFNNLVNIYFNNIKDNIQCYDSKISDWRVATKYYKNGDIYKCGNKDNYYKYFFAQKSNRSEISLENAEKNRTLLCGDFILFNSNCRECADKKVFKIMKKNEKGLIGIIVNEDSTQFQSWDMPIKDYF